MNRPITMPALSDTMNDGRLVRWLRKVGDPIRKGDALAEVETDKALMDVEAFHDGVLTGPLAPENAQVPVGSVIGYVADDAAQTPGAGRASAAPAAAATAAAPAAAAATAAAAAATAKTPPPAGATAPAGSVRASPYARRLAQQLGVDLTKLDSGQAAVHADAILDAAHRTSKSDLDAGPPYRIAPLSSIRASVARTVIRSLATPVFRVAAELPIGPLKSAAGQAKVSFTLMLARAAALAVKDNPLLNAAYTPEGLALRERVDVGIAIDTPGGLIAAVLRDVGARSLAQLAADWHGLRERVDSRRLKPEDYRGATFYLSNLGTFPVVHSFDAVLPPGAAAILCVGAAEGERAVFTLGCDHRVLAGADAARFLQSFARQLAEPGTLAGGTP